MAGVAADLLCEIPGFAAMGVTAAAVPEPFSQPLRLPPVAEPADRAGGVDLYRFTMRQADVGILPGLSTAMLTFEGVYPGPTILAQRDRPVVVEQRNALAGGRAAAVHLHGAHVPPEMDGHPLDLIPNGGMRTYRYPNHQPGATLWYHDHTMHRTAEQVYRGLAGLYLLEDPAERSLALPSGDRDLPLVLADKSFAENGDLVYDTRARDGFVGDVPLVNGVVRPFAEVAATSYRLRLVNTANARTFSRLGLTGPSGGVPMTIVATDAGLVERPVTVTTLSLAPSERVEVVVDLGGTPVGSSVVLADLPITTDDPGFVRFDVTGPGPAAGAVPDRLASVPALPVGQVTRRFSLDREASGRWVIDGEGFRTDRIDAFPRLGEVEVWQFTNTSPMAHPMHLHAVSFQVLERRGADGRATGPTPAETGWKDTVQVGRGETVSVAARFSGYTGTFVYHCHILEHEDHDMMSQFRVVDVRRLAGQGRIETAAAVSAATFSPGVPVAYVATAAGFADALAGGPVAAARGGPMLLTTGSDLATATAAELERLGPGEIVVVGGPAAVPESVVTQLRRYTSGAVQRVAGASRFETAAALSRSHFAPGVADVYVATGRSFPDALAGGVAAAVAAGPMLLVDQAEIPGAIAEELRRLQPRRITVLGGPGAVADSVRDALRSYTAGEVARIAGQNRYETAVAVSQRAFPRPVSTVYVATGADFPDALAGVPAAASAPGPLLLAPGDGLPAAVAAELHRLRPQRVFLLGGPTALSPAVEAAVLR